MARRILPARRAGLTLDSPFKRGETAERVLAARLRERAAETERKRAMRTAKKVIARVTQVKSDESRELRRLRRALARRRTLAARQRIEQRIHQLESELS